MLLKAKKGQTNSKATSSVIPLYATWFFPLTALLPCANSTAQPLSESGRSCWLTSSHWWVTVSHSWQTPVIIKCSGAVNSMVRNETERAWETRWGSPEESHRHGTGSLFSFQSIIHHAGGNGRNVTYYFLIVFCTECGFEAAAAHSKFHWPLEPFPKFSNCFVSWAAAQCWVQLTAPDKTKDPPQMRTESVQWYCLFCATPTVRHDAMPSGHKVYSFPGRRSSERDFILGSGIFLYVQQRKYREIQTTPKIM